MIEIELTNSEKHKIVWDTIASLDDRVIKQFELVFDIKEYVFNLLGFQKISGYCYACHYASFNCNICPIFKSDDNCNHSHSLYSQLCMYLELGDIQEFKKNALKIANLKWGD